MDTFIVKCACTFRVQTESAEEARQKALAQATAAGATSIEVDFVFLPERREPIHKIAR